ncbi:cation:proton antiporter [Sodalinema gerasimenkoae]|uniref:cation:proton antiporter domain-containing protein n=1 Tax=Sodalinema gerasimenkoae TaxID=2862348 RepID=UPI0013597D3B|nr:cation:proton antiporter [Sodalinema gerasimenkoae]
MDNLPQWLPDTPIVPFTVLLLVVLTVPPLFERLRLPGLVGLIAAGVVLGSDGLGILDPGDDYMKLFTDIGKIYLMFVAGLEIDLSEFQRKKDRSLVFGFATFAIPLTAGTFMAIMFGYGWNAAILIGSLLASHTLLGYPIVSRLGVAGNEAVTVTIGATIFTDIAALLVLAICVSIHGGDFSATSLIIQVTALALYTVAVLVGLDKAGKLYFRRTGDEESNQFLFILLAVFLAAVGAQIINVDQIVGAFLAGLAVNDVVGRGPVENKVEFVGSTLFIPFFFVGMGLLLDITAFMESFTQNLGFVIAIVLTLLSAKFLASMVVKLIYRYSWNSMMTMWSLSIPQVAATLAAALAGFDAGLIPDSVFNSVVVLMLITSVIGPLATSHFARKLPLSGGGLDLSSEQDENALPSLTFFPKEKPFKVVVPVSNPLTERYLIEMAAILARQRSGSIVPLSIAEAHLQMDEPELDVAIQRSERLLERAMAVSNEFDVEAIPRVRIDSDVAHGISRTAREENASTIVMGWNENIGIRARLFGSVVDSVFWSSHCPVGVMRLLDDPLNIHQILVPVKSLAPQVMEAMRFAQLFAESNQAELTLLHVCDRRTTPEQIQEFETALMKIFHGGGSQVPGQMKTVVSDDIAQAILEASQEVDMVVLCSRRRRTAGGLAVSDVATKILGQITCSMVLFGEPHW